MIQAKEFVINSIKNFELVKFADGCVYVCKLG